jgi:hypothetical protein
VHHNREAALRERGKLAFGEEALEHEDAARVMALAQPGRDIELQQRQAVRIFQRGQDVVQAMPVRIRLHDSQYLRAGGQRANARHIGAQRGEIDLGVQGTGHA